MLTNKDIDKLMKVFPAKEDVRAIVREENAGTQDKVERALTGQNVWLKRLKIRRENTLR